MSDLKIVFTLNEMPSYGISHKGGRKTFEFNAFDGMISCLVQYTARREPLTLNAAVNIGDKVEIILMDHRIELYVNGRIKDEEWPMGERLYQQGDEVSGTLTVKTEAYVASKVSLPAVISTFTGAEGWKPDENVFVGDCMPYVRGDEFHILYLKDRHHHKSKWGLGAHQWEHISSRNMNLWSVHPMAVEITEPEEGSICTGSWIADGQREYLFYTVRMGGGIPAPVRRSYSDDGAHFEKDKEFGFVIPERYHRPSARDPKMIKGDDGLYHMLLTTSLVAEERGCLAHFVSDDMTNWRDAGEPIYISEDKTQPECPDYIRYGGRYYLIFSLHGSARYLISDRPFEGWREPKQPIIPCGGVPKGAVWKDEADGGKERIVFVGFKRINGYAGTLTFRTATADETGELIFH